MEISRKMEDKLIDKSEDELTKNWRILEKEYSDNPRL